MDKLTFKTEPHPGLTIAVESIPEGRTRIEASIAEPKASCSVVISEPLTIEKLSRAIVDATDRFIAFGGMITAADLRFFLVIIADFLRPRIVVDDEVSA